MSRRIERIESLIRETLGELLLSKVSDPRVDPARTSITRVQVADDLTAAKVYVSVIGDERDQKQTVWALRHAAGRLQELLMSKIELRNTPVLDFRRDEQFKKTLETYRIIEEAMAEIREKEAAAEQADDEDEGEADAPDTPREAHP